MILGHREVSWKPRWSWSIGRVSVFHRVARPHVTKPRVERDYMHASLSKVPVFLGSVIFDGGCLKLQDGHRVYGGLYMSEPRYRDLLLALQNEPGVFRVREGAIHGRWTLGPSLRLEPFREGRQWVQEEPVREAVVDWLRERLEVAG